MTVALEVQNIVCAFETFAALYILWLWLLSSLIGGEHGERGDGRRDLAQDGRRPETIFDESLYAPPSAFVSRMDALQLNIFLYQGV